MLKRHFTADSINEVVNDPSVAKWVKGKVEGSLDLGPMLENPNHVLLMGEHGGVLFFQHQPGLYEAHVQVLPAGRGKWTLDMVTEALHWMFTRTDAVEITTRVPKGNLGARALVRAIHGTFEFHLPIGWWIDGEAVYADVFSLSIQSWTRTAPGLTTKGVWFHNKLEAEFDRIGKNEPNHPDDPIHDRYVGAAVDTLLGGQPTKAVVFYNRWASMAGYEPIQIVSEQPLVIDIKSALIRVRDHDFWVMGCR